MRNIFFLKLSKSLVLATALAKIGVLAVIGFGAAFQQQQAGGFFEIPGLWFFSLMILPVLIFFLVKWYWSRHDRLVR